MPTAGTPYNFSDIIAAKIGFWKDNTTKFQKVLREYFQVDNIRLVNSGTTACYLLLLHLKSIRKHDKQTEIIITNYTAPSLLLPIQKAGLECVVVDISIDDFNIDLTQIENTISDKTLAIMPIHMFGIPTNMKPILEIAKQQNIFLIEDAASSLGSKIDNLHTGTIADFGFYSLNRGKNISTLSGGIISWKDEKYTQSIDKLINNLPILSLKQKVKMLFRFFALTLAVRPFFYTILQSMISRFKYTSLHEDFDSYVFTTFQVNLGVNLWKRVDKIMDARLQNGKELTKIFYKIQGVKISKSKFQVVYNQFPILIDDLVKRENLEKALLLKGIETSRLYEKTLHQIYPEKIKNSNHKFPNSKYLAEHLLLIPPHPQIKEKYVEIIQETVTQIFK